MRWLAKFIGFRREFEESHINYARIKSDKLPNPTKEEREVGQLPVTCQVIRTTNRLAWFLLQMFWRHLSRQSIAALLVESRCLKIYPIPPAKRLSN